MKYEWVVCGGMHLVEVGQPSKRRKVIAIVEFVFTSERDARAAAKQGGGEWVKRKQHATRKVEMRAARNAAKASR